MYMNDTIAAISTPLGEGAIGIIRLSGPEARSLALQILRSPRGFPYSHLVSRHMYYAKVINPTDQSFIDEVLFFFAPASHSYSGEDMIEIQAHGGTFLVAKILNLCLQYGARQAEPGEFTQRAFLNGRIDLVQAESIIDLIRAKTERAHELALAQLSGSISRNIQQLENQLYQILIAIEAWLDYPEEGLPEIEKASFKEQAEAIERSFIALIHNFDEGRVIREGIALAIIGRPNVGKSSLFNAFLQEERAIVTEIPGTTRDLIEVQFQLKGIAIRLIDTAGFRNTENLIENIGISKAKQTAQNADLLLLMFDGSVALSSDDQQILTEFANQRQIIVINKTDLPQRISRNDFAHAIVSDIVELSLLNKQGFNDLQERIIQKLGLEQISVDDRPVLSRIRHKHALETALIAIRSFRLGLEQHQSEDLLAVDLRTALEALGAITGKSVTDEVVHGIFSQFCIGK